MNDGSAKVCSKCGEPKPIESFSCNRSKGDGFESACKACCYAQQRAWTVVRGEHVQRYKQEYREKNRERLAQGDRARYLLQAEERKAKSRDRYAAESAKRAKRHRPPIRGIPVPDEKACTKCGAIKPLADFGVLTRSTDGHSSACSLCLAAASRASRATHPDAGKRYYESNRARIRAAAAKYAAAHAQVARARARAWKQANPERARAAAASRAPLRRQLYAADPERYRAYNRACKKANAEAVRARNQLRRARKASAGGRYSATEWVSLCRSFGNVCLRCGSHGSLTVDHVVPITAGGSNEIGNIQPLCRSCNSAKGRMSTDYRPDARRLLTEAQTRQASG